MQASPTCSSLLTGFLALALSACVVVPVEDRSPPHPHCRTYTKNLTLEGYQLGLHGHCDEYCLSAIAAVAVGSLVISGSIVVINNTVHWLEYQGTCSDGYLNLATQHFVDSFSTAHK